ncbi:MAG: 16S rRNA (adenine(1518)-N(6)/adenine(1519)-N(6))-dimethyltransferase RsmA [Kiritimatiellia bacterium]
MNLASPSNVRSLLKRLNVRPSRRMGQNFLVDSNILGILTRAAAVKEDDTVFEPGPGLGILTGKLLEKARQVVAVEKDRRLFEHLREALGERGNLRLIHGDACETAVRGKNSSGNGTSGEETAVVADKVVSNLPFSTGSRILCELAAADPPPSEVLVTVQLEVAKRLTAPAGSKDYGLLSLWTRLVYDVKMLRKVSPGCFWPKPAVYSAIVRLKRRGDLPGTAEERGKCRYVAGRAFARRRKQMATILKSLPGCAPPGDDDPADVLEGAGIEYEARPAELAPEDWMKLIKALTLKTPGVFMSMG